MIALLFLLFFVFPALAVQPVMPISSGGNIAVSAAHDGKALLIDATAGQTVLEINDIAALGPGFHIPIIYKTDPGSGLVGIRVTKAGDRLNHFWTSAAPYPLWLNMTQQAAELICDGIDQCFTMGKSFHHNVGQSQRTFTATFHSIRPQDQNEEIQLSPPLGGQMIAFDPVANFSPPSPVTGGNYHSHWVRFRYVGTGQPSRIFPSVNQCIGMPGGQVCNPSYVELNSFGQALQCYITAAQIWCAP